MTSVRDRPATRPASAARARCAAMPRRITPTPTVVHQPPRAGVLVPATRAVSHGDSDDANATISIAQAHGNASAGSAARAHVLLTLSPARDRGGASQPEPTSRNAAASTPTERARHSQPMASHPSRWATISPVTPNPTDQAMLPANTGRQPSGRYRDQAQRQRGENQGHRGRRRDRTLCE